MSVTKYKLDKRVLRSSNPPSGTGSLENIVGRLDLYDYIKDVIEDGQSDFSVGSGITASTTQTQTAAILLDDYSINIVDTVANSGDAVKLPLAESGTVVTIKNDGANTLQVFPNTSDTIDDGSANASITIEPNETVTFYAEDSTNWETDRGAVQQSGQSVLKVATVTADATAITNWGTTPITLVSGVTGKTIVPVSITAQFEYGSAVFTTSNPGSNEIRFYWKNGGTYVSASNSFNSFPLNTLTVDGTLVENNFDQTFLVSSATIQGADFVARNLFQIDYTGGGTGSSITFTIIYREV